MFLKSGDTGNSKTKNLARMLPLRFTGINFQIDFTPSIVIALNAESYGNLSRCASSIRTKKIEECILSVLLFRLTIMRIF